jgi:hypothetical protein
MSSEFSFNIDTILYRFFFVNMIFTSKLNRIEAEPEYEDSSFVLLT